MSKTLIVRYNRIGDALIVLPLIYDLASKNKSDQFTVISNPRFSLFFELMPPNVTFIPMVMKRPFGFLRGFRFSIKKRTLFLKLSRRLDSYDKIAFLQFDDFEEDLLKVVEEKGIKYLITNESGFNDPERIKNKCHDGITVLDAHKKVFSDLGYTNIEPNMNTDSLKTADISDLRKRLGIDINKKLIAVAPFSRERTKTYPIEKMKELVGHYSKKADVQVLIYGGGPKEERVINGWIQEYPEIISLVNKLSFDNEILIMAKCKIVLTMDSANMHLASLLNVPTVSVWGATVPACGYYKAKDNVDTTIIRNVDCQPCSCWGGEVCIDNNSLKCLNFDHSVIVEAIDKLLLKD